jgi:hypothetical protein
MALAGLMLLLSAGASLLAGWRGVLQKRWTGTLRWRGLALVSLLHLLQPLARAAGRIQGMWHLRKGRWEYPDTELLYGNLEKRERWLERLLAHMKSCGWIARPCSGWDDGDIEVLGPGPHRLKLTSVYEDVLERGEHYVRFRITVANKRYAPWLVAGLMGILVAITQALYLAPLALPVLVMLYHVVRARKTMMQAVSQMAMDCGWPIGMPKATANY